MGTKKAIHRTPQAATIHVRNFRALADVLRSLGADPARILECAGLEPNLFDDLERTIPYTDLDRLLSEAMRATGCRDVGLHIGVLQGVTAAGLPGLVSMNSPTVREAWRAIIAGLKTTDSGGAVTLEVRDDIATLGYCVIIDGVKNVEQFCDASVAIIVNAMRQFCGAHWRPDRVYLMNEPPADLDRIEQFFWSAGRISGAGGQDHIQQRYPRLAGQCPPRCVSGDSGADPGKGYRVGRRRYLGRSEIDSEFPFWRSALDPLRRKSGFGGQRPHFESTPEVGRGHLH